MSKETNPKALGLIALVVVFAGGGATYWQYSAVSTAKAKIAQIETEIPSEKELQKSLSDSSAKLSEYKEMVQHLEKGVPDIAYIPTLMKELEQVGVDLDIDVIGVRPVPQSFMSGANGDSEENTDYDEIELEVTIRGHYEDSKRFLDALEQFSKIVAVTKVNMKPERAMGDGGKEQIETKITVSAYVFPFDFNSAPEDSEESQEAAEATVASINVGVGS